MRPRIVDFLNDQLGTEIFEWLVPYPSTVYALTMLVCLIVFVRRVKFVQLSQANALKAAIFTMFGGLIGTRVFFLVLHLERMLARPEIIYSISGGTASWGAYLGGAIGFWGYFARRRKSALPYLDVLGSMMGLGPFIGRWSCFLNGDDFGTFSNAPWAVVYPHGSIPFTHQVQQGLIDPLINFSLAVHPNQLYLSLNGLVLFFIFTLIWKRYRFAPGILFCLYWAVYSFNRFFLEFFRGSSPRDYLDILSFPQIMTVIIFFLAGGGILWLRLIRQPLPK
jgi:phosphatidylglycerol:prolipoprotein diacylglycerol transferase